MMVFLALLVLLQAMFLLLLLWTVFVIAINRSMQTVMIVLQIISV
jgi:hypothetical protein